MSELENEAQKETKYRIKVTKNGPYIVSGESLFRNREYVPIPMDSATDGKKEINFDGTETAVQRGYLEQATEILGPDLKLTDAKTFCAGAKFCHRSAGTWKLAERSDGPEARQMAIEEACECPSGRLVAWDKDGAAIEPDFEPSIGLILLPETAVHNMGPLWMRGNIPIESADGKVYEIRNGGDALPLRKKLQ
ncbi:MAG TPA: (4Fe-4S)-binding protein [Candidatus Aquicultor sp.]|jgi:hypothetical protein